MQLLQFLKQLPLFSHLVEHNLVAIADTLEEHIYCKNALIFREKQLATHMFLLAAGEVKIFKLSPSGKEHLLQIMGKYSVIAEAPMFEGATYPVSCAAKQKSILFAISREKLIALIKDNPQIALNMLALQAKKLREFTSKIEQLSLQKLEQKLATYLTRSYQNTKGSEAIETINDHNYHTPPTTLRSVCSQDLANYLGIARETLSRLMNDWIRAGLIKKDGRKIVLLNPNALKKIINA